MVCLPAPVVRRGLTAPVTSQLLVTDSGYFPRARHHVICRDRGIDEMVVIFCVAGSGFVSCHQTQRKVATGQAAILPPRVGHSYLASQAKPWTIYWAHAKGTMVNEWVSILACNGWPTVLPVADCPSFVAAFRGIIHVMEAGCSHHAMVSAAGLFAGLLGHLMANQICPVPQAVPSESAVSRLSRVIRAIDREPAQTLSVSQLAESAQLSPSHFSALFRQKTGHSVLNYVIRRRLILAGQLLRSTDLPIKQIAFRCGYEDPLYFSRAFCRVMGVSPSQHRNTSPRKRP